MIPTQEQPGHYWMTGDRANLWFSESGTEAPKTINCHTPHGGHAIVKVDDLELLGVGFFGESRPCLGSSAKWTGECYRYGIYAGHKPYSGPCIVILQHSGSGMEGLQLDSTTSFETWSHLAASLSSELLWNACRELFEFHQQALEGQKQRIFAAFATGRLKKSRKNGIVRVTMEAV